MGSVAARSAFVTAAAGVAAVLVLATAATGFAGSSALEPAKTIGPAPSTSRVANPTVTITAAPTALIPSSTIAMSATTTPVVSTTGVASPDFDAAGLFTDLFAAVTQNPTSAQALRDRLVQGSSAEFFFLYLYLTAAVVESNTDSQFPPVTVAPTTDGIEVCTQGQPSCDVFSDFVVDDDLLATFSINGIPIDGRLGVMAVPRSYESLTFVTGMSFRRITNPELVVVMLMSTEASTTGAEIRWSDAVFTDDNDTVLPIDLTDSLARTSLPGDSSLGVVLRFADAPPSGTLTVPVSSDGFVTSSVATIVFFAV